METAGSELFLDEYSSLCKKIRVLHVAEPAGGVDTYLKTLFRYLDSSKVENILVCSQNYDTRAKSGYLPAEYIPHTFWLEAPSPFSAG